ncbi:MAG: hypothetical protein L6V88_05230 [Anaerotruncus sp.]|nr:MAG: hypothetical protein L6V88_05230 [Anaerotruncus sp.]
MKWNEPFVDGRNCFLNTGGNADVKFYVGKAAYSTDTWSVSAKIRNVRLSLLNVIFQLSLNLTKKILPGNRAETFTKSLYLKTDLSMFLKRRN